MHKAHKVSGETLNPEQVKLKSQLRLLSERVNNEIYEQRKHLVGSVLTIVEAVISDPEQRKATKDLINNAVYGPSYWNNIRYQFERLAKASGFELFDDVATLSGTAASMPDSVNEYEINK